MSEELKSDPSGNAPLPGKPGTGRRRYHRRSGAWQKKRPAQVLPGAAAPEPAAPQAAPGTEAMPVQAEEQPLPVDMQAPSQEPVALPVIPSAEPGQPSQPESKPELQPKASTTVQPAMAPAGRKNRFSKPARAQEPRHPILAPSEFQEDFLARLDLMTYLSHLEPDRLQHFSGLATIADKHLKFPGLECRLAKNLLVEFVKAQFERLAGKKILVGVSGGLDSAVAAFIAVEAVGRDKVRLVHCIETEKNSFIRSRAESVGRALQCPLSFEDLRPVLKSLATPQRKPTLPQLKARIARERMAALLELADSQDAWMLGSVNKTKQLLGTGTAHGDLAGPAQLLGDVYQSQVLELARHLSVPAMISERLLRVQGADGKVWNQNVEPTIREMDYYLYQIMDVRYSLAYLQKIGMEEEKLIWIYQHLRAGAGHRQQPPQAAMAAAYVPCAAD